MHIEQGSHTHCETFDITKQLNKLTATSMNYIYLQPWTNVWDNQKNKTEK